MHSEESRIEISLNPWPLSGHQIFTPKVSNEYWGVIEIREDMVKLRVKRKRNSDLLVREKHHVS